MRSLPISNRAAVTAAPSQTSRQATSVSGSHLNIMANRSVIMPNETMLPRACIATSGRSEEHTSELQSHLNLVCRLLLAKKNTPHGRELQPTHSTEARLSRIPSTASPPVKQSLRGNRVLPKFPNGHTRGAETGPCRYELT